MLRALSHTGLTGKTKSSRPSNPRPAWGEGWHPAGMTGRGREEHPRLLPLRDIQKLSIVRSGDRTLQVSFMSVIRLLSLPSAVLTIFEISPNRQCHRGGVFFLEVKSLKTKDLHQKIVANKACLGITSVHLPPPLFKIRPLTFFLCFNCARCMQRRYERAFIGMMGMVFGMRIVQMVCIQPEKMVNY